MSSAAFDWSVLTQNVRSYIKSLNFKSRANLTQNSVAYKNQLAAFLDPNTIVSTTNIDAMQQFLATGALAPDAFEKTSGLISLRTCGACGGRESFPHGRGQVSRVPPRHHQ